MEANCHASKAPDPLQPLSPLHQPGERHLSMGAQRLPQCCDQRLSELRLPVHIVCKGNYTGYMHLSCALKEAEEAGMELQPPVSLFLLSKSCLRCHCSSFDKCAASLHTSQLQPLFRCNTNCRQCRNTQTLLTSGQPLMCELSYAGVQALEQARILLVQGEVLLQASS